MKLKRALLPKKKKKESRFKYYSGLLHLWMGLLSSIVVLIVCITGCIYVFKNQITDFYNRDKVFVEKAETRLPLNYFQDKLEKENNRIISINIPVKANRSIIINYADKDSNLIKAHHFNPYTGENLGGGSGDLDYFFSTVENLHKNLLLGDIGKQIVGAFMLIFILMLLTGLVLWWPKRRKKQLKRAFTIKWNSRFHRLNHDLHNTLGFYSLIFLLFISITGVYITYPWVKSAVLISLGGESVGNQNQTDSDEVSDSFALLMADMLEKEDEKTGLAEEKAIQVDSILLLSNKQLSYKGTTLIHFPDDKNPRFRIQKISTSNWLGAMLPDFLEFDKKGELKKTELFKDKPLHKQFQEISKPLHTGELMGIPSLSIYFLATLVGFMLPITGFIIWWKKI